MTLAIKELPAMRLAAVRHTGPYNLIGPAFRQLGQLAFKAGLFGVPGAMMIGVYKDDPALMAPEALRSVAGVVVPETLAIPDGLVEENLSAGRFACFVHEGSYEGLPAAWMRIRTELMPASGHRRAARPSYELYLNDPSQVPAEQLRTEICIPIE